ncbi:1,4-alpha-glucan branching protein GlgB [Dissulfurirhabdus thermomarina]|uniref:1,4-alpha-glucan branching enzyme GlgB n=1 Tax=Dissulfurirhabdus thermomarina TaxID=1765737 RepID=A0A6N9TQA3_DISTH|nr:1,4-alpha-glucan branching protein GlgB [Dissulfurirhabdus thermomarina]NDY43359.1 1,4-alpha-glucan branching protein GlgB [Dissulfurirhabdus thermomarina]NMX24145.1 1,4-alpha-glucan branching protein GlgB [Dissulfurirhabdus thermomarina]
MKKREKRGRGPAPTPFLLTDYDLYLHMEGTFLRAWEKLGAHPGEVDGTRGTWFAVWAPNAERVFVVGDFNGWREGAHELRCRGGSGVWEAFVPGVEKGALYKFVIRSRYNGYRAEKADPYGFFFELRPRSASIVWDLGGHEWGDGEWMAARRERNALDAPISIYEVHLGSWMRAPEEGGRWLTYRELAPRLAAYARDMGFTHVELLPVMEHPLDASWGYQVLGYFAPTSRFGTPQDFMFLVDTLHRAGIGVILDWVPAHFPTDGHGLAFFDGTHLYEHADPRQREHKDWGTFIFNYGRREVAGFLLSNALFWLDVYHVDGLRVDAVASMLYLDYSREEGEWIPNAYGGRENLDAVAFIRRFNEMVYREQPGAFTVAEESTAWPMVSRPTYLGGLGFGYKWNMGWMHDTLLYMSKDPVHRKYHHNNLTFSLLYAFHENFILPFSHDEVVHGKGAMLAKMPGDLWQRFANLRLLYGYMYAHPGKKLLFMGCEIGQWNEWNHDASLDWHLLDYPLHQGLQSWVRDLNHLLRRVPALHEVDFEPSGFSWIDCSDSQQSVLAFLRRGRRPEEVVLAVCNFTPVPRHGYRLGVPAPGPWREVLNSDAECYGGSGQGNMGGVEAEPVPSHGHPWSVVLTLPPLGALFFRPGA